MWNRQDASMIKKKKNWSRFLPNLKPLANPPNITDICEIKSSTRLCTQGKLLGVYLSHSNKNSAETSLFLFPCITDSEPSKKLQKYFLKEKTVQAYKRLGYESIRHKFCS